ncbi:hypothetical protein LEN26_019049 [Aphanomyces euteiches]|nr:hypothetical protein LEN26_019049 [Aphanomyces euteiches]
MGFITTLHPCLMQKYVDSVAEKWSMSRLASTGHRFTNFPHALYATDVTFQQTNAPSGSYADKKLYFSGKHHLYGHKVEVSVLPCEFALGCSAYAKGSVADKTIFDDNLEFHCDQLKKRPDEVDMADSDDEASREPKQWAVMADKGYQGIQRQVRAILPDKKQSGGILTWDQSRRNDRIAADHSIVEIFFGRMKTLWAPVGDCYHWNRKRYDLLFKTCLSLTNVHVRFNPLRKEDGEVYAQYVNRLKSIGRKLRKKKKSADRAYRTKRKARLALVLAAEGALSQNARGNSETEADSDRDDENF